LQPRQTIALLGIWQKGLGIEATGIVKLGSVVFLPSSTTVSTVKRVVGDTVGDGDTVLTLSTPTQEVLVDVPAGDEAQVVPGLRLASVTYKGLSRGCDQPTGTAPSSSRRS